MTSELDKAWHKKGLISRVKSMNKRQDITRNVHRTISKQVVKLWCLKVELWEQPQSSTSAQTVHAHEFQAAQLSLASKGVFLKQKSTQADAWKPSRQGKQGHISNLNSRCRKRAKQYPKLSSASKLRCPLGRTQEVWVYGIIHIIRQQSRVIKSKALESEKPGFIPWLHLLLAA